MNTVDDLITLAAEVERLRREHLRLLETVRAYRTAEVACDAAHRQPVMAETAPEASATARQLVRQTRAAVDRLLAAEPQS